MLRVWLIHLLAQLPHASPPGMSCLIQAYPEQLCGGDATHLIWCDGTRMPWRTHADTPIPHRERLNVADLRDQMAQPYPRAWPNQRPPPVNYDPGRLRSEAFFRKMYGDSAKAVSRTLTRVRWLPNLVNRPLKVTTINGVDRHLAAVSADLEELDPALRRFFKKTAGTFVWRTIKGTNRLSMHSFAIAIDVGIPMADYWRWRRPNKEGRYTYRNRFPKEVVEVFERHGFIWGGQWYHFDTMHFEYRPELLIDGCRPTPLDLDPSDR